MNRLVSTHEMLLALGLKPEEIAGIESQRPRDDDELPTFGLAPVEFLTIYPLVGELQKEESKARRCAYCLLMCDFPVKICTGCKKRAYCSKKCQVADWSNENNGQHHVNWCRNKNGEYGEEDIDWEIFDKSPANRLMIGIRAKKMIPAGFKIIVEPVFTDPYNNEGMKDLVPKDGSLEDKFKWNQLAGHPSRDGGKNYVALRISWVNNSDSPNAEHHYNEIGDVVVLKALKDIQPGEEILIKTTQT